MLTKSETPMESTVSSRETPLWEFGMSESVRLADNLHIGAMVTWSESAFAQFAFDLIAMIQGTYEVGRLSSFYGMGSSFSELMSDVVATIDKV